MAAGGTRLRIDFTTPRMRRRMGESWKNEPLLRAVGRKPGFAPVVLDATGGLGRDGFILAAHGCRVTMCEENPLLAALLEDALRKAGRCPETAAAAARITLVGQDSVAVMAGIAEEARPDTVYLDPMYPEKKKTARSAKEMEFLRALCGESRDDELLAAAMAAAKSRVAIKRPKNAPPLAGQAPDFSLRGPAHRFDIHIRRQGTGG